MYVTGSENWVWMKFIMYGTKRMTYLQALQFIICETEWKLFNLSVYL
jgi:hypothetical protein